MTSWGKFATLFLFAMTDNGRQDFVILSFVLFVKTIERALCVFKDLQKRFKEPYVLFFMACKQKI